MPCAEFLQTMILSFCLSLSHIDAPPVCLCTHRNEFPAPELSKGCLFLTIIWLYTAVLLGVTTFYIFVSWVFGLLLLHLKILEATENHLLYLYQSGYPYFSCQSWFSLWEEMGGKACKPSHCRWNAKPEARACLLERTWTFQSELQRFISSRRRTKPPLTWRCLDT